jgi:nucleoside-triphosphatase THEP1
MSKITEQELATLTDQESKKLQIIQEVGSVEARKHQLLHILEQILSEQEKTKIGLEDKYGKINIDLNDGSFTEIKEEL